MDLRLFFGILLCFVGIVTCKIYFQEDFSDPDWEKKWTYTSLTEYKGKPFGRFSWTAGKWYYDVNDKGIRTMDNQSYYAISQKIQRFSNKDKPLVIQYTVKHEMKDDNQDERHCAGSFIKLFPSSLVPKKMNADSKFLIKFGHETCTAPGKVEAEILYKGKYYIYNPRIEELWDRKVYIYSPYQISPQDALTHLYTIVFYPNNTYKKLTDGKLEESGRIDDHWQLTPPRRLQTADKRPETWEEREFILDPTETKPVDWDQPEFIDDPYASQPEDWDADADGPWEHPVIQNPAYKGEWMPTKLIPNPAYDGVWHETWYDNPEYKEDPETYLFKDIGGIGIECWQQQAGSLFDNILVTDDLDYALTVGTAIQKKRFAAEEKEHIADCEKRRLVRVEEVRKREAERKRLKKSLQHTEL